jgi:Domain of unknown function (DUF4177)
MSPVTCPSCGEKGNLSDQFLGKKIRCQKCGNSFLAVPTLAASPVAHAAHAAHAAPAAPAANESPKPAGDSIEVEGLDPSTWAATAVAVATHVQEPVHHELTPAFTALPQTFEHADNPVRQYKVLTSKDRFFEGKYEFARLEDALNHYARQGWVVRAMATPHVTGFSGGPREELVILMERS